MSNLRSYSCPWFWALRSVLCGYVVKLLVSLLPLYSVHSLALTYISFLAMFSSEILKCDLLHSLDISALYAQKVIWVESKFIAHHHYLSFQLKEIPMNRAKFLISLFSLFLSCYSNSGLAKGSDLKFQSLISSVSQTDTNTGTVTVSIHGLDLAVIVNGDTEIKESGEEIGLASLSAGDFVEISSFLSDEGIVADEIKILDERTEQFRLRGLISAVDTVGESTFVTLLGVEVTVNGSTDITRRGSGDGNSVAVSDLMVGDEANVRGGIEAGVLVAARIHVGTREQGDIELEGEILSVTDSGISIQIENGGTIDIVIDGNTITNGDLAVGAFVEVEGRFNTDISLIATEVVVDVDGDGDADDDNLRGGQSDGNSGNDDDDENDDGKIEIGAEIRLKSDSTAVNGKLETRYRVKNNVVDQNLEVEIEDAPPGNVYLITVLFGSDAVDFGTMTTDERGNAEAEFETGDDGEEGELAALLPDGLDVRDITGVQILLEGDVVLEGDL